MRSFMCGDWHILKSSGHCLSTTASACVDSCKSAAHPPRLAAQWRRGWSVANVTQLSRVGLGGRPRHLGVGIILLPLLHLCLQWALDAYG